MSNVLYRIVSFIADGSPRAAAPLLHYAPPSWAFLFCLIFNFQFSILNSLWAQDTVRRLDEVEVSAQRVPVTTRTAAPTQVMDAIKIEQQGALQLSDAVKQMAGVVLKDYGGVGGMKTVSARGLGSQFSTVTIDGVAVDNSQNGQVDLGRFLTGNAAYVSLSQGQVQQPLLSARAYAAGNVLNLETAEPQFHYGESTNLKLGMELGSFGLMNPTARWEQKWGKRLRTSLWSSFLKSDGNYPFTLYGQKAIRQHSAMRMFITDGDLFYTFAKDNTLTAKVHYMRGMHELPGEVVLYNPLSAQSTHEEALFAQVKWKVEREKWKWQLLGKVQRSYDQYEDSAALGYRNNYMENHYLQHEGYLSGSSVWSPLGWLELSASADGDLSHLQSNLAYRNDVLRSSLMAVAAARLHSKHWEANAHLLGTAVTDRVNDLDTTPTYRCLSPYAALMWSPNLHLTLRYFYKETYRVPNFSELYFFLSTPRNLRPEQAHQHNIGISWVTNHLTATVDGYFNRVVDKIVAKPGYNMYYWTMENLGLVHILGVDATGSGQWTVGSGQVFSFQLNYSFAHAVDMSDPTDEKTYGHQIRYTPRHSGGGNLRWENRWVNLGATAMVVGHRYTYAQNNISTRLPAYCDLGLSADRSFELGKGTFRVRVQVLNLLDTQYEVVKDYPMMGRNYRLAITYDF